MTAPLRVAVVGAGAVAQVAHLPLLARMEGAELVGVCDIDRAKAQSLATRFGIPNVFDDIEALLQDTEPAAVVVCTPNHLHEIHVQTALSAGAHVLCERPLALSVNGVRRVVEARRAADRVVMVGMNHRYRTDTQAIRTFVTGGELGQVHGIRGGYYTFQPARQMLGWRRRRQESGGGAMLDLGLPLIDLSLWLADATPERVTASLAGGVAEGTVEDGGVALIQCAGGLSVVVDVSWRHVGEAERLWLGVNGTGGSASLSPFAVFKELNGAAVNVTPLSAERESPYVASYAAQWTNFVAVVRGDMPVPVLDDQLLIHSVMDALYRSAREGRSVDV